MNDLSNVPDELRPIVETLLEHQRGLSDGFGYYTPFQYGEFYGESEKVVVHLCDIAAEIYNKVTKAEMFAPVVNGR